MPQLGPIGVYITVDGERLPEYKVENESPRIVTCHIPSDTGKNFHIVVDDNSNRQWQTIFPCSRIELDGQQLGLMWPMSKGSRSRTIEGMIGTDFFRAFTFADLRVTDDEESGSHCAVGLIKVSVAWCKEMGEMAAPAQLSSQGPLNNDPINEKSKKLTSHRVILGELESRPPIQFYRYVPIPGTPFLQFHFHYANKDLLSAWDVIPGIKIPPTPQLVSKVKQKESSPILITDEMVATGKWAFKGKESLKRSQENIADLKSESSRTKKARREVKYEPMDIKFGGHEVIDLTGDD